MAVRALKMASLRLKTKTEGTWWYLWHNTWSCLIDYKLSETLCDKVPGDCATIWPHLLSQNTPNYDANDTTNSDSSSLRKKKSSFCILITMQFKVLALLFLLWEAHKYWFSCQIKGVINANLVVDLTLVLFRFIWHSVKVTPHDADMKLTVNWQVGISAHISFLMPFPPADWLEWTNSAVIISYD